MSVDAGGTQMAGFLDLSLPGYAELTAAAGVDPDAEALRLTSGDPGRIEDSGTVFTTGGEEMDRAWAQSMVAQEQLAESFRNNGADVYDLSTHLASLPTGFRDAGTQLVDAGRRLTEIGGSLRTSATSAAQVRDDLFTALQGMQSDWAGRVAAAGLISEADRGFWEAERQAVSAAMVSRVGEAGTAVRRLIESYEGVLAGGLRLLADQGVITQEELDAATSRPAPAAQGAPGEVDPAGLGIPIHAGYAADPVNTAIGNFVEVETDLEFTGLLSSLTFARTYNSRSGQVDGPFGPRWSSWATTRLVEREHGAAFKGPDGQQTTFRRDGAGFARAVGVDALVERGAAGLSLAWFDGRRWDFDASGRPLQVWNGPGTDVEFGHDDSGRLIAMSHSGGRRVALTWDAHRVASVTCSDGRAIDYLYDEGGHLVRADSPSGVRSYDVDAAGLIVSVTDADGVVELVNTYDEHGRVRDQLSRFGRRTVFAYLPDRVTTVSDETGGPVDVYGHDDAGRLISATDGHGHTIRRSYDVWGNPVRLTARNGAVTVQEFDARAHLTRRILPSGAQVRFAYDDVDRLLSVTATTAEPEPGPESVTRFSYRGAERIPSEILDPEGGLTRLSVASGRVEAVTDPDGVVVRFAFDADGHLVAAIDADGGTARIERGPAGLPMALISPSGRRTEFGYDTRGRLTERRDPDGAVWRHEYSAAGRPTAVIDPTGARTEVRYGEHGEAAEIVDPLGAVTTRRFDAFGNVVAITAAGGATWTYTFDALSRLAAWSDPAGATWLRDHDIDGNLVGSTDPTGIHRTAVVDQAGQVIGVDDGLTSSAFTYDGLGRATSHVRPDGAALRATYDRCGRRVTETSPDGGTTRFTYTPAGRVQSVTSPAGRVQEYAYDQCGRLVAGVDGTGARWELRYDLDGAVVERAAPSGAWVRFGYDSAGRPARRDTSRGTATTWAYDTAGRVVSTTSPLAGTRRFGYDAAGRLTSATDALGHTTRYAYDVRGRLVATTDPLGGVTSRDHDEVGRLIAQTDPLGRTTRFGYDAAGYLIARTDPGGTALHYAYDRSGRIRAVTGSGESSRIDIERDVLGRPVTFTEPGRTPDVLSYDIAGRLVERRRGEQAMTWSYDPDGLRATLGYPDRTRTTYRHDAAGRTAAMQHPLLGTVWIGRDPDGRVTRMSGEVAPAQVLDRGSVGSAMESTRNIADRLVATDTGGATTRYGYDSAGQLSTASGPGGDRTWAYDPSGRLVAETGPDQATHSYTYDLAGQLQTLSGPAGERRFSYDSGGRRTAETGPDGTRRYERDWLGRLTAIQTQLPDGTARTTNVVVDALGELAEVDGTPLMWDTADPHSPLTWIGRHAVVTHGHHPLAVLDSGAATQPDPRKVTDGRDATADPWGSAAPGLAIGYRGEVTADGLVWLRHRTYDPSTRAFLSTDPLPSVPGTAFAGNPYHYAGNDPVNRVDPLGLRPLTDQDMQGDDDLLGAVGDWFGDNWEYVAAGGMAALGVGLMFTGVGGIAGIGLMAASGALLAGAGSTAVQRFQNGSGNVNWSQVGTDALVGGITGGVGGAAGVGIARLGGGLASLPTAAQGAVVGGLSSVPAGALGRGLTGGNPLDPQGIATDLLIGGAAGGVAARLGGAPDPIFGPVPPPLHRDVPLPLERRVDPHYLGEHDALNQNRWNYPETVHIMSPSELEASRLFPHDGRLFRVSDGAPYDTSAGGSVHAGAGSREMFVMDPHGNLYSSAQQEVHLFHHSSFFGPNVPVADAGELAARDGYLLERTLRSGHYKPPEIHNQQFRDALEEQGIDMSGTTFRSGW